MRAWKLLPLLLIVFLLAACGSLTAEIPAATNTIPPGMLPTDLSPTSVLPTLTPTEPPTLAESLDGQTTFAVIAAVEGNIATIQLWLAQGLSVFERQAVVGPLTETAVAPLGDILQNFIPQPALAESWAQATDLHSSFYPALQSWVQGDIKDADFEQALEGMATEGQRIVTEAGEIAAAQLGVDTARYGPDYTLANDVVFELTPLIGTASIQNAASQEAPELVVQTLTPFTYSFAGTDVFTVVGVLENTGTTPLTSVEIEVRFYNEDNTLLGITTGVLSASTALPGQQYPFNASTIIQGEEKVLFTWDHYETRVLAQPAGNTPYQDFILTADGAKTNSLGEIELTGTLTNTGSHPVPTGEVHIGAAAYDANGTLVGVGSGSATLLNELTPGASAPFEATISALNGEPVDYQFFAESNLGE